MELVSAQIDKQVCWPYLNKSSKSTAATGVATGKASYCDVVSALVSAQWSGLTAQDLNTAKVMPGKKSRRATLSAAHLPSRQRPAAQPGQKEGGKNREAAWGRCGQSAPARGAPSRHLACRGHGDCASRLDGQRAGVRDCHAQALALVLMLRRCSAAENWMEWMLWPSAM